MKNKYSKGFSILEVILAAAIFMLFATGAAGVIVRGFSTNRLGVEETIATQFASEGIEAVRSIKNQSYASLVNSTGTGVDRISNVWAFGGANDTLAHNASDNYTRIIKVEDVQRDALPPCGNIVSSGGTLDPDTKKITSTVTWNFAANRNQEIELTTYLSDWKEQITPQPHGGILIYGDGDTTSDAVKYRILDGTSGTWGGVAALPDFDTSTTNKALRAVRIDASPLRNEKIVISRHVAGSNQQSIWAHVFNGASWTSTQFSSWTSNSNLDVRNFDGAYLNNGTYIAVYSDNTSTAKYRIWDGCDWSTQSSLVDLANNGSGTPLYIVTKNRPGTNEVMAAFFGTGRDTNTQYYDGSNWILHSRHSAVGPGQREMIDFAWSPNDTTKGALVFPDTGSDRQVNVRVFTADGSGSGDWTTTDVEAPLQSTLVAMDIDSRSGASEFIACSKDSAEDIRCFRSDTTPSWTTPSNNDITNNTDSGRQRSFNFNFESTSGSEGIAVYSTSNSIPKLRIYNSGTNGFGSETNLTSVSTALESVRLRAFRDNDDIMILLGNTSQDLYTVVWNGTTNTVYTNPSGKAFTLHGISGSHDLDFWYDFAWDRH
ncbi:hypothetical protein HYT32_00435 [Candidatus Roizmanbacteria bacterium]|nr:hypothetical protein [Candidatus Roizmanbacteria bacterium]